MLANRQAEYPTGTCLPKGGLAKLKEPASKATFVNLGDLGMKIVSPSKRLAALALVAALAPAAASAQIFLNDWSLNLTGTGGAAAGTTISEYLDFVGASYIETTPTGATTFSFTNNGAYNVNGHDGGSPLLPQDSILEMTGLYSGGTGTGQFGGDITFAAGGLLDLYADTTTNFGTATDAGSPGTYYGANDGTPIGSFVQTSGTGTVDTTGVPNGQLTLIFEATSLAPGYWFDSAGTDLSTQVGSGLLFGFVTTNASYVENPSAAVESDIVVALSGGTLPIIGPPDDFVVGNNGQFRLSSVPEPASIALLGIGLLGAGLTRKRKAA
jgi:hypothetical protein